MLLPSCTTFSPVSIIINQSTHSYKQHLNVAPLLYNILSCAHYNSITSTTYRLIPSCVEYIINQQSLSYTQYYLYL
jgi:hypothetical protein